MVLLIGGASHTGKTLLSNRLVEEYKVPCTSLDHIKMGLSYTDCGFKANDVDRIISEKMWGFVSGFVNTCLENKQNTIIEGCYLPPDLAKTLVNTDTVLVYLILSPEYIINNFHKILAYESVVEKRLYPENRGVKDFILENEKLKIECQAHGVKYFEIKNDYDSEILDVYKYIRDKVLSFREYKSSDLENIIWLFKNTVAEINKRDYSDKEIGAWIGNIDKEKWQETLSRHYTIVAELFNKVVGFGDINQDYLDRLFIHKNYNGLGLGGEIANLLEEKAERNGFEKIYTHASITAKDFFVRRGYEVNKKQHVVRDDIKLCNYVMEKKLK